MLDRNVHVETADGAMPVFVTCPERGGPFAPIVLFMDIWGFRELLCDIARRIGTVGYAAVVPNLYYRKGGVTFDHRLPDGRTRSLPDVPEEEQERIYAVARHLTDDMVIADCGALLDFFDADPAIRDGPVGSIGWCMGGRHVICAAGAHPERFRATVSLHPVGLVGEDEPDAPYRCAPDCTGEIYIGYGAEDPYTPAPVVETVGAAFTAADVGFEHVVHAGAQHGYAIPDRDVFDKHAAARDWERAFAIYRRMLA